MFELNQLRPRTNSQPATAHEVELRSDGSYIQWRYKGFNKWIDIISLKDLTGAPGKNGKNGVDGTNGKDGAPGADGKDGQNGIKGTDGIDGKQGLPGKDGKPGINGVDGKNGLDGADGREIELQKSDTHIQWRYKGDSLWKNLAPLSELKGEKGEPGEKGKDGADGKRGPQGYPGTSGSAVTTFETVSKNIKAWDAVLGYTGDQLTTITYTKATQTIIKTLNYTLEKLTSIVLSGDTPSGIQLTKTLSYTGDQLTGIEYA